MGLQSVFNVLLNAECAKTRQFAAYVQQDTTLILKVTAYRCASQAPL